jgi:hypothetical protein
MGEDLSVPGIVSAVLAAANGSLLVILPTSLPSTGAAPSSTAPRRRRACGMPRLKEGEALDGEGALGCEALEDPSPADERVIAIRGSTHRARPRRQRLLLMDVLHLLIACRRSRRSGGT